MKNVKKICFAPFFSLLFFLYFFSINRTVLAEEPEPITVSFDQETYTVTYEVTHPEYEYVVHVDRPFGAMSYYEPVTMGENTRGIADCLNKNGTYYISVYAFKEGDRDNILLCSETISFEWEVPTTKTAVPENVHLEVRDGDLYACWNQVECSRYGISFYENGIYKYSVLANPSDTCVKMNGISFDAGNSYMFSIYAASPNYAKYLDSDIVESEALVKESGINFEINKKTARIRYFVENNSYLYHIKVTRPNGTTSEFYDAGTELGFNEISISIDLTMDGTYSVVVYAWDQVTNKRVLDSSVQTFEWKRPEKKTNPPTNPHWEIRGDYVYAVWDAVESNGYDVSLYVDGEQEYGADVDASQNYYRYFRAADVDPDTKFQFKVYAFSPDYQEYFGSDVVESDYLDLSSLVPKKSVLEIFDDLKEGAWYINAVQYAYDNKIMLGKGDSFNPGSPMTRAEFVQVLYNHSGATPDDIFIDNPFSDVVEGKWYVNAVRWAKQNNIASGNGDGTFGVKNSIKRQAVAVMLYNYAAMNGYDTSFDTDAISGFSDADKVKPMYEKALKWAVSQGVMSGKGESLDPTGTATRAECASMIMKLIEKNR